MSAWDLACVACDAGASMALAGVIIAFAVGPFGSSRRAQAALATLTIMFVLGVGACATEDRVCEIAERVST